MAATITFYDSFTKDLLNALDSMAADTFKVMLLSNLYAPDQAGHAWRSDLTNEITGAGYTAGGQVLAGIALTVDHVNHLTKCTATNSVWDPVTFTNARYAVVYKSLGGMAGADPLLFYVDFGANENKSAAQFSIVWNAGGVFTLNA